MDQGMANPAINQEIRAKIGNFVRLTRQAKGISIARMDELTQLHANCTEMVEAGTSTDLDALLSILQVLGVRIFFEEK